MSNEQFRPFPEIPAIYDRSVAPGRQPVDRVWFPEAEFAQAADVNEAFSAEAAARTRIGDMTASNGDRIEGADAIVDRDAGAVTLTAGRLYVMGDIRAVPSAVLSGVPMVGEVRIGIRVVSDLVTLEEDESLAGLHPGTEAESEAGAVREVKSLTWGWSGDGEPGDLIQVYLLVEGFIVDQSPPPGLSGVNRAIADYDYQALGNYIARGCAVTALGSDGEGGQVFSIEAGVANILGFKRTRESGTRFVQPEEPDIRTVVSEPHTFQDRGDGSALITVNRPPINGVSQVIVTKQATETIVRGAVANTSDLLSNSGVQEIVSVTQAANPNSPFVTGTDFVREGDRVSWAPGGNEPATGSSYVVTYKYLTAVAIDSVDARGAVVSGGVHGAPAFISYSYKLPRHDRICFDKEGLIVYLKGIAAAEQPQPPKTPETLLSLAIVQNDWFGAPIIINDGTRSIPFETQTRYFRRLVEMIDLVALERGKSDISFREPTAKHGMFVDPLTSDRYRDAGAAQDGAVFNGTLQIAIDPTFAEIGMNGPLFLDYQEVPIVVQDFVTGCMKINPYQNFTPPPLAMTTAPARDFWTETNESWLSPATQVFGWGNTSRVVSTEVLTTQSQATARFLRQISVAFTISGMGEGETLDLLTFDGIDVTPAGPLAADETGTIEGTFTIPANVTAGTKQIYAETGTDRWAASRFTGEGRIETIIRQQVTTVQREQVNPPSVQGFQQGPGDTAEGRGTDGTIDPLAQSFALTQSQHVTGVDVRFCSIGDRTKRVICEIVSMDNGWPTPNLLGQAILDMTAVVANTWQRFQFTAPVFLPAGQQFALVFKTDDADHALAFAKRGGFDAVRQQFVGAQPYTVGVMFSSSNAVTWTAHQDEDLAFRIHAARFNPTTKTVSLGVVPAVSLTDFIMEATVFLPTGAARVQFEVEPVGESAVRIEPGQVWERQSPFTGNVRLRAILTGSEMISPVVAKDLLAIMGTMRASGTYISRLFDIGTDVRFDAVMKTRIPAGATIEVSLDYGDDDWTVVPQTSASVLADGTLERTFSDDEWDAPQGRLKIVLTGTPAARPSVADLRAFTVI